MHSSGNLHQSKDVCTMWTDVSSCGQMRRRICYIRTCDVDDARQIFFFQGLLKSLHIYLQLHSAIKSSLSEVFFCLQYFFFKKTNGSYQSSVFQKSVSRFRQRLWRYIGTGSIKGVVSAVRVYNIAAVVYVDPSTCRDLGELAFCVSYRCLDAVHEG